MLQPVSNILGIGPQIFLGPAFKCLLTMGTAEIINLPPILCFNCLPYFYIHSANWVYG